MGHCTINLISNLQNLISNFFFAILLIINSIISLVFIYLFSRFYMSREQKIIIRIFKFFILLNKFIRKL